MKKPTQEATNSRVANEVFKIWIKVDHYIPVDRSGYVLGTCAEGSLGCVIQMIGPDARFALKIPRLLADTIRENAYIVKVTDQELKNVLKVGHLPGLVPANRLERTPLKYRRSGLADAVNEPDAQKQDRTVIFVSFEKEKNPRFCTLKFEGGVLLMYPPDAEPKLRSMTAEIWESLRNYEEGMHPEFGQTVFWSTDGEASIQAPAGLLEQSASALMHADTWYAAVPAIIYDWAIGSLQEAIGKLHLREWHFSKHFRLFEQILKGVNSLHTSGMLHADIRPANVMSTERQRNDVANVADDLSDPEHYRLADYGSFGNPETLGVGSAAGTGNTMIGPGVGAQRVTPFYSRERRAGVERESADTAIIMQLDPPLSDEDGAGEFFIRLGWRTQLLEANSNQVRPKIWESMQKDRDRLMKGDKDVQFNSSDALQKGDRLRLREYVFEVIQAGQIEEDLICRVRRRYARVIHDRLAVYDATGEIAEKVVSLSNYVELRQWSAATDLYSVGAICLYTLFCTGIQKHGPPSTVEGGTREIDALFGDLINTLESVPHFRIFWAQLELFRGEFETFLLSKPDASAKQIAEHMAANKKNLAQIATDATNQICQSAPHAKVILQQLDMNLAHFILFMHFIMSCLHRQTHLDRPDSPRPLADVPFCKNRIEPPADGAAKKALERLSQLRVYHTQSEALKEFVREAHSIHDFNPKPNVEILEELAKAKEDLAKANQDMKRSASDVNKVELQKTELEVQLQEARKSRLEADAELQKAYALAAGAKVRLDKAWPLVRRKEFETVVTALQDIRRLPIYGSTTIPTGR